ncbi:hypothetical protein LTS08_008817 [Lithohypha guttulata]|nr:hypothetical protein LTS08_008817 [Lithohypha guttulata]
MLKLSVRSHTSLPVPNVLAWNSDSSNPVGAEYLVLGKVAGRQLNEVWDEMTGRQRFRLVTCLAQFDAELSKIRFPAYGSLYYRATSKEKTVALPPDIDPKHQYCVGPVVSPGTGASITRHEGDLDNMSGPWYDLTALGATRAQLGIWNLSHGETKAVRGPHFGSREEHLHLLTAAQDVIATLAPLLKNFASPVLWHPDLHMGNVFVSEEDYTKVVGLIDWQFTTILPTLTQAQWPLLLTVPDDYETGPSVPKPPAGINETDPDEQKALREKYEESVLAKCYEIALNKANPNTGSVLSESPEAVRQLFLLCPDTYKDGIVPLRDCLIKISKSWEASEFPGSCPIQFTSGELSTHHEQLTEYDDWRSLRQYTFDVLSTDEEGWVPPQLTFEAIRAHERKLFQLYMNSQESGITEEKAKSLWFFS